MGSWESRLRLSQVVPVHSQDQDSEAQTPGDPGPRWTLPALPVPSSQRTRLPPLKRAETTPSTPSGNHTSIESNNRSIIHSHPPKRLQILQPPVFPIGHTNTGTANAMLSGGRSGGIPRCSTPREDEHHGAISQTQEGFLRAQGALRHQAYQHRRVHHRQAREHRRSQKTTHPSNGVKEHVIISSGFISSLTSGPIMVYVTTPASACRRSEQRGRTTGETTRGEGRLLGGVQRRRGVGYQGAPAATKPPAAFREMG